MLGEQALSVVTLGQSRASSIAVKSAANGVRTALAGSASATPSMASAAAKAAAPAAGPTLAAAARMAANPGPRIIGSYTPSPSLAFGTTTFGNEAHIRASRIIQALHPDVIFDMRVLPGQRGIDITVISDDVGRVGWKYGEIKPLTSSGEARLLTQSNKWLLPEEIQAITYDAMGNVYYGFR
jgi:hypothetical protein